MTDVLILGGTGWLSGRIAERWMDAGASVTCLARGTRPVPYGARLVVADRDEPEAYDAVRGRDGDEVVEVSSRSTHVAAAAAALAGDTRHLTYVSSVSVYAANNEEGADEGASLVEPAALGDDGDDARAKAACEAAVRAALPHRAAIVRPGLIGGPATPPIASGIGCRASRSPRAVPCSCRTHQSCACRSSTSTIWQRSSPPSAPQASAARSTRSGIRRRFPRCSRPHARYPEIACRWRASTASSSASTCTPL